MNSTIFTVLVNSTRKELFTTESQTISGDSVSSEDASLSTGTGGMWTISGSSVSSEDVSLSTATEGLWTISGDSVSFEDASLSTATEGLWITEIMATFSPIVTDGLWEQIITATLLILFWIYVNLSNGFLFYILRGEHSLHTPQYMVLVSYMVFDTLYCNLTLLHMVPTVIRNSMYVMSTTVSRILVTASASFLFSTFHLVGLISYERLCYFVTPLKYPLKFTRLRICTAVIGIYLLATSIVLSVDLISPRIPVATTLTYQAVGETIKITNIIYAIVYAIPSGTMSVLTLIKLRLLISKHKAQMQPAQSNGMSEDQSAVSGIILEPVKKALKMVGLVSGSFWLTIIPGFLIRIVLSASGVSWEDTDHRISLPLFALSRASYMLITVLSSVLNPIIYMAVLVELREAVWKRIGIKRNNTDIPS